MTGSKTERYSSENVDIGEDLNPQLSIAISTPHLKKVKGMHRLRVNISTHM
ncbi:hypothetical protein DsansV1_C32g0222651 [Dioscorea sansibarensis]